MKTVTGDCRLCRQAFSYPMNVTDEQIERWNAGEHIYNAMPDAAPEEREVFITGLCKPCQAQIFA